MHLQFKPTKRQSHLRMTLLKKKKKRMTLVKKSKLLTLYFYYILTFEYTSSVLCNEMGNKAILWHAKYTVASRKSSCLIVGSSELNTLSSWNPILIERTTDRGTRAIQTYIFGKHYVKEVNLSFQGKKLAVLCSKNKI